MAQVKFTNLKLKVNDKVSSFDFGGQTIEVKQYLPVKEKLSLVSKVVQNSMLGRILRSDLLEIYLNLEIVDAYTNITFTEKQKEKNADIYDALESNGIFEMIISHIPEQEYETLLDNIDDYAKKLGDMSNIMVSGYSTQVEGMQDVLNQFAAKNLAEIFEGEGKKADES